jgi:hypothetical protein
MTEADAIKPFVDPYDEETAGVLRGGCPVCLGPSRALYARIELTPNGERGSFGVRGAVVCLTSRTIQTVRGESLALEGVGMLERLPSEAVCTVCQKDAARLFFQVRRDWLALTNVEACRYEGVIRNIETGATVSIPRPLPHPVVDSVVTADPRRAPVAEEVPAPVEVLPGVVVTVEDGVPVATVTLPNGVVGRIVGDRLDRIRRTLDATDGEEPFETALAYALEGVETVDEGRARLDRLLEAR